jgi:hypothetical protein
MTLVGICFLLFWCAGVALAVLSEVYHCHWRYLDPLSLGGIRISIGSPQKSRHGS